MKLQLVALDGVKLDEETYSVSLPTLAGDITVYPDHEPLIGVVKPGIITVRKKSTDPNELLEHFATYGGVLEVTTEGIKILVDEADTADDINEQEAEKAHKAALELKKQAKNQVELEKAQALVDRSTVRLQVAGLKRRNRHH